MQIRRSLEDLEKIYAPKKNFQNKPDLHYDSLKIAKDEFNVKIAPKPQQQQENAENDFDYYDPSKLKQENFIEIRTFLPTIPERMISSRYENPLTQLKSSTMRWKIFTLILTILSFIYFSLNLCATLVLSNISIFAVPPRAIIKFSDIVVRMQDVQFYSYTMNIVMDLWAMVMYTILFVTIIRESSNKVETMMNEKGSLGRITRRFLLITGVLFGLSYIVGTVFAILLIRSHVGARDMTMLVIFHLSKMIYLLINVFAVRRYRSNKFVYEDLLLEALGSSGSVDEPSELDDHMDHYPPHA